MIFVVLGTQDKQFLRLIKKIEELKLKGVIKEKVIVQAGNTKYESNELEILSLISMKQFNQYIKDADYIITHGGVGTILDSLKQNKKVIAVPRLQEYGEHENNHQLEIINEFSKLGYVVGCEDINNLERNITELKEFKPIKYSGNNDKMIKIIEGFINEEKNGRRNN